MILGRRVRRGMFGLIGGDLDGHDDVGLDLDDLAVEGVGDVPSPGLLVPQVAAIADDQRGPVRQLQGDGVRAAATDDEGEAAAVQRLPGLSQALEHEVVVTQVGLGVAVHQAEADQERLVPLVRPLDGVFQGVVELGPLALLHPVEDVLALRRAPVIEPSDA